MSQLKPVTGNFCWNELRTSSSEKAKNFYTTLFGWKAEDNGMGYAIYTMFKNGETTVG